MYTCDLLKMTESEI